MGLYFKQITAIIIVIQVCEAWLLKVVLVDLKPYAINIKPTLKALLAPTVTEVVFKVY